MPHKDQHTFPYNLYENTPGLSNQEYLVDLLQCAQDYDLGTIAKTFCMRFYNHNNLDQISADLNDARYNSFIENLDPIVAWAICNKRPRS